VIALIDMATQLCRTASLDRPHGSKVTHRHRISVKLSIGRPKSPKDVGHL
jgi:hypothetical protein